MTQGPSDQQFLRWLLDERMDLRPNSMFAIRVRNFLGASGAPAVRQMQPVDEGPPYRNTRSADSEGIPNDNTR